MHCYILFDCSCCACMNDDDPVFSRQCSIRQSALLVGLSLTKLSADTPSCPKSRAVTLKDCTVPKVRTVRPRHNIQPGSAPELDRAAEKRPQTALALLPAGMDYRSEETGRPGIPHNFASHRMGPCMQMGRTVAEELVLDPRSHSSHVGHLGCSGISRCVSAADQLHVALMGPKACLDQRDSPPTAQLARRSRRSHRSHPG